MVLSFQETWANSEWSKCFFWYFFQGTANATSAINHHWFLFVRITQTQSLGCHLGKGLTLWTLCTFEMTHIPFLAGETRHMLPWLWVLKRKNPCPVEAQSPESNMTCNKEFAYYVLHTLCLSCLQFKGIFKFLPVFLHPAVAKNISTCRKYSWCKHGGLPHLRMPPAVWV